MTNSSYNETFIEISPSNLEDLPVFRLRTIHQINRLTCGILGIPLNLLVMAVILRSRQLWSPRNIFWLAVTFFSVLALIQAIIELCIYLLYRRGDGSHQTLCQFYSTTIGGPYVLLLAGLMLATWERYLALTRHRLYQRYGTPKNICWILFGVSLIITGTIEFNFQAN